MGLPRKEWLETPRGQRHEYQRRHLSRILAIVDKEPLKKDSMRPDDAARFQGKVREAIRVLKRSTLTGPVALELHFSTSRRNPPALYALAKNYLDLLGRRGQPLLYRDDSQVKYLAVN